MQLLLTRFAIERLMYRLAQSAHRDTFILKGAMLFSLWARVPYRSTGDLDLLGQGDAAPRRMEKVFRDICTQATCDDDGLVFDPQSVAAAAARPDDEYSGVRVTLTATLGNARLPLQVDIGFGDVVTPTAQELDYPSLLDFPQPRLRAYPRETVVAEKLEALVSLGMRNSRMKDFFDLWVIAKTFDFNGAILARAVAATFKRRHTALPDSAPVALTGEFSDDATKQAQWKAFLGRTSTELAPGDLPDVVASIAAFASPLLAANAEADLTASEWSAGGPWRQA